MAWRARRQFFIARLVQQRRKPAGFQFRPAFDHHVGVVQFHDEAGLGIHEMRVFRWFRQRGKRDFVAADFLRNGCEVRRGSHDVHFRLHAEREHCPEYSE